MSTIKKIAVVATASALVVMLTVVVLNSQQEPQQPPQLSQEQMQQMMVPMIRQMIETMMDAMFTSLAKKESAEKLATFNKNYYDALLAQGFTKEQALQIVVSIGIPSIPFPGNQ